MEAEVIVVYLEEGEGLRAEECGSRLSPEPPAGTIPAHT
jgi:hypothetical protein